MLHLVRRSFTRRRHYISQLLHRFFVVLILSPLKTPALYSGPDSVSTAFFHQQIGLKHTSIATLILPISVTFEAKHTKTTGVPISYSFQTTLYPSVVTKYKKAQLSLTNPRDACEKFARFT